MATPMGTAPATGYGPTSSSSGRWNRLYFDGDERGFEMWETKFLGYMRLKELQETIDPTPPTDNTETPPANAAKNANAYAELIQFLDDRSLGIVMRDAKNDGRKALKLLREHYSGTGKARLLSMYISLGSLMKDPAETITDYILKAEKMMTALRNAGEVASDSLLISMVMKGLPDEYESFCHINTQKEETDWGNFKKNLRNFEENERVRKGTHGSEGSSVYGARGFHHNNPQQHKGARGGNRNRNNRNNRGGGAGGGNNKGGGKAGNNNKPGLTCYNCGGAGHKSNECPSSKGDKWCNVCKNNTHNEADCRKKNAANVTQAAGAAGGAGRNNEHTFQFRVVDVYKPKPPDLNVEDNPTLPSGENIDIPTDDEVHEELAVDVDDVSTCVSNCDSVNSVQFEDSDSNDQESVCDSLLVDTGATSHIVSDESTFTSVDKSFEPKNHYIELADGSQSNELAKMRGNVDVTMKNEQGEIVNSVLQDALHIPSFPQDIFSVHSAIEQGAELIFKKNSSMLIAEDGTKFNVSQRGKLFYIDKANMVNSNRRSRFSVRDIPVKPILKKPASDIPKKSHSLHVWHRIMGHCNTNDVLQLESVVDGMKITEKQKIQCEPCILGKQIDTRSRKPDEKAKVKMEFVHTDLTGKITPVAREGFQYAITFVDDFSGTTFVYFLKKKSDASKALQKFLAESAPFGTITKMRSDGGGEFESDFHNNLIKNKIHHEESAPYSPHQNGTVERGWRTLFEMARCLLIESKLPLYLWTYAVMAAVYIRNRCYSQRTKQTPYYMLTGKQPNISNMHVFGTICYGRQSVGVKKLDPRCDKGVFLGYDKKTPGYLVYYPDKNRISTHRVVTFTDSFEGMKDTKVEETLVDDEFFPHDSAVAPLIQNLEAQNDVIQGDVEVDVHDDIPDNEHAVLDIQDDEPDVQNGAEAAVPVVRRPARTRKAPDLGDFVVGNELDNVIDNLECVYDYGIERFEEFDNIDYCFKTSVTVPKTYKQAVESDQAENWRIAMDKEMDSLQENNTYTLVPIPEGAMIVGGRWVFALKVEPGGNELYKARYVAKGFAQREGYDYFETFAPTAKMSSVRMLMQVSAELNLTVHQMDVKTAYLNAPIDTEIFMSQPKGYEQRG